MWICSWQTFPGFVYTKMSLSRFLRSLGDIFFLHVWPLLMIIFLVYQRNFSTVFCFHFVKNVYQSHGHFFVDKYASVLLKCTLFWKILSTCGHWEGSTVNWVQPSPIITQAVGDLKSFIWGNKVGKTDLFSFLCFAVYTLTLCISMYINVRFFKSCLEFLRL